MLRRSRAWLQFHRAGTVAEHFVVFAALGVDEGVGDIIGILASECQVQVLGPVTVITDADGQHVQPRPGSLCGPGRQLNITSGGCQIGDAQGPRGLQLLKDQREGIRTVQPWNIRDRHCLGRRIGPVIDLPAQDPVSAWRGGVEAFRCPRHPVLLVAQHLQG